MGNNLVKYQGAKPVGIWITYRRIGSKIPVTELYYTMSAALSDIHSKRNTHTVLEKFLHAGGIKHKLNVEIKNGKT